MLKTDQRLPHASAISSRVSIVLFCFVYAFCGRVNYPRGRQRVAQAGGRRERCRQTEQPRYREPRERPERQTRKVCVPEQVRRSSGRRVCAGACLLACVLQVVTNIPRQQVVILCVLQLCLPSFRNAPFEGYVLRHCPGEQIGRRYFSHLFFKPPRVLYFFSVSKVLTLAAVLSSAAQDIVSACLVAVPIDCRGRLSGA